jgi:hypothetical protein
MPFALTGVGLILIVTGIQDTYAQFGSMVQADFQSGFLKWAAGVGIIGALGYIPELHGLSIMFLALIIVAIFLTHSQVFTQATQQIGQA